MRRLFAILALAACLPFAGCDKEETWGPIDLGLTGVTMPPEERTSIRIFGGSDEYSVATSNPAIAEVYVEATYGAGIQLIIESLAEGIAVVTVTDDRSGLSARLSLTVARYTTSFRIADIEWSIDADTPAAIEAALKTDTSVPPVGGSILMNAWDDDIEWTFADADEKEFAHGTLTREDLTEEDGNPIFGPLLPAVQFIGWEKWTLSDANGEQREFHMYIMRRPATRLNVLPSRNYQYRFCEDVTERYKTEFPDAGVRSVARVLISNGDN